MEKSEKMVLELTERRKMTKSVIGNLNKRIFLNLLIGIGMMLYICAINFIYIHLPMEKVELFLKIFAMIGILITVIAFEIAYKKDSGKGAIVGIELLMVSIVILFIPEIYRNLNIFLCRVIVFIPVFCAIYYVAKSIMIYIKTKKYYQNHLSDVRDIVKED